MRNIEYYSQRNEELEAQVQALRKKIEVAYWALADLHGKAQYAQLREGTMSAHTVLTICGDVLRGGGGSGEIS